MLHLKQRKKNLFFIQKLNTLNYIDIAKVKHAKLQRYSKS